MYENYNSYRGLLIGYIHNSLYLTPFPLLKTVKLTINHTYTEIKVGSRWTYNVMSLPEIITGVFTNKPDHIILKTGNNNYTRSSQKVAVIVTLTNKLRIT